ncbi:MAG TPA: YkvA family protein [Edaphobacter sp.]|jgi:uncharacterized membrane protein YkvA (DUF1232 family)|nr:YkvA family protein [Edaphobacter sp.]
MREQIDGNLPILRVVRSLCRVGSEQRNDLNEARDRKIVEMMEVNLRARPEQIRQRLATTLKNQAGELFRQYRIMLRALRHPGVPWYAKLVCGCAAVYVISPIQLIPNFIPIIGQLDDVLLIGLSIKLLKRSVPPAVLDQCRNASRAPLVSETQLNLPVSPSPDLRPEASP